MGYFTQQIYNQPQSMYVDPRLDILANSAGAIQQRHDKAVSEMNAYDIMAANLKVVEGDDAYKRQKIAELQASSKAISNSGDYALAQPRINLAAKGFLADENLITMQDNYKAIQESEKIRQQLGSAALDFNPASGFSTIDPATGKARRFTGKVEKQEDWDGIAQNVTKLIANEKPTGLTSAAINGYLQTGTISGISKQEVDAYLGKAYDRFVNGTTGGKQMYRKLTEIDKLNPREAQKQISSFLANVGDAQIHSNQKVNYMYDQVAGREDGQQHDKDMENMRYQKAMDVAAANAAAKAKDKIDAGDGTGTDSRAARLIYDLKKGTSITDDQAAAWFPTGTIKDNNGANVKGFNLNTPLIIKPAHIGENYNPAIVAKAQEYTANVTNLDKEIDSSRKKLEFIQRTNGSNDPNAIAFQEKINAMQKQRNEYIAKNPDAVNAYNDYKKSYKSDPSKTLQLGIALSNLGVFANMQTGKKNIRTISGQTIADINARITGAQLVEALGEYDGGSDFGGESEGIKMLIDQGVIDLKKGEGVKPDKLYTIKASTPITLDAPQLLKYDEISYGKSKSFFDNANRFTGQVSHALAQSSTEGRLKQSQSKFSYIGEEVVSNIYNSKDTADLPTSLKQVLAEAVVNIVDQYKGESESSLRSRIDREIERIYTGNQ